jgi:hypothetical protein
MDGAFYMLIAGLVVTFYKEYGYSGVVTTLGLAVGSLLEIWLTK